MPKLSDYQRNRLLLSLGVVASCALFWAAGRWFGIPQHPGFEMSLALQPTSISDLLLTGVTLLVATAVATAVAGTVRFDGGLFCGAVGLAALSGRGGPTRYVTQAAQGPGVYIAMAVELVVLGALLGVAWLGLWLLYRRGRLAGDALRDGLKDQRYTVGEGAFAMLTQAAVTSVLVLLLARTDEKKQVLAAVGFASFFATLLAYTFTPVRPSVWFWAGPILSGVVGYLFAYSAGGSADLVAWKTGAGTGTFAPLARPLPLDYASLGTAGAILGYWTSRQWQRAKELEKETAQATGAPAR